MADSTVTGYRHFEGEHLLDSDGQRIGTVDEVYIDPAADRATWALVHTGLLGLRSSFVPLTDATQVEGGYRVPYTADQVRRAPAVDDDAELSHEDERRLFDHYGIGWNDAIRTRVTEWSGPAPVGGDAARGSVDVRPLTARPMGAEIRGLVRRPSQLQRVRRGAWDPPDATVRTTDADATVEGAGRS